MPFASFPSPASVAKAFQITCTENVFVEPIEATLAESFLADLEWNQREIAYDASEFAICESLIFPLLKQVWKPFSAVLSLWSHVPLCYDEVLSGVPDYIVAKRSPLGKIVFDQPYLIVMEAKKDNFDQGWGQCLAAMLAAQKMNKEPARTVYGIACNGRVWQFGRLDEDVFTQDPRLFTLTDPNGLSAALRFVFEECKQQATAQACAT